VRTRSNCRCAWTWFRTGIPLLPFDNRAAAEFDRLRQSRIRIGTMDLKIAAIALANDATLLTRNLSDFRKVPGLRAEDWST
jgi:tRNA(fMet)-specific endonuclease VapC